MPTLAASRPSAAPMEPVTAQAETKEYIIITSYPEIPPSVKSQGREVAETYRDREYAGKLFQLERDIREQVIKPHGGEIVSGGGERNSDIIVRTTSSGLEALKGIEAVRRISERIDFGNLTFQPDGVSNVPPGVCWSRPY